MPHSSWWWQAVAKGPHTPLRPRPIPPGLFPPLRCLTCPLEAFQFGIHHISGVTTPWSAFLPRWGHFLTLSCNLMTSPVLFAVYNNGQSCLPKIPFQSSQLPCNIANSLASWKKHGDLHIPMQCGWMLLLATFPWAFHTPEPQPTLCKLGFETKPTSMKNKAKSNPGHSVWGTHFKPSQIAALSVALIP